MPRHRAETEDDFDNGYYAQEQGSIVQLTEKAIRNIPAKAFPIGFDITVKPKKETSHALPNDRQALPHTNDMPPRKPVRGRR